MHKNIVSNNLKEFVLGLEAAVKEGYSVVEESVDFNTGYFKVLTKQDRLVAQVEMPAVIGADVAVALLDNPGEPNEKLKEILEVDEKYVIVAEGSKEQVDKALGIERKPNRKRK